MTLKTQSLTDALWRDVVADKSLRVYSLQDGAASPRIYANLVLSMTDHACLYEGRIPRVLLEAAPHIVRLQATAPYTPWFLQSGWNHNWGLMFQSKANLMALRAHFQRLLLVKDEWGSRFNFRFYDPRVLRSYLPSCTPAELTQVFGPVERFFVQGEAGDELIRFDFNGEKLMVERLDVGAAAAMTSDRQQEEGVGQA